MLTPKETIELASYLQLAQDSKSKRRALSDEIIEALGLKHVQNRRVGGLMGASPLSGGERRRLSVGMIYSISLLHISCQLFFLWYYSKISYQSFLSIHSSRACYGPQSILRR